MPKTVYLPPPQRTYDFDRIFSLPRRSYDDAATAALIESTSAMLARDKSARFWEGQAVSIGEFLTLGSVAACLDTGLGKTLLGLALCSLMPPSARVGFCMPTGLVEKTKREAAEFNKTWKLRNDIELIGYGTLSSRRHKDLLDQHNFDLLVFDEVQNVTSSSARGARVTRHIEEHPVRRPRVAVMSASLADRDIEHAAKAFRWSLGMASPLPISPREVKSWAAALDPPKHGKPVSGPGILAQAAKQCGNPDARSWYMQRIADTPGVVVRFSEGVGASMTINRIDVEVPAHVKRMIEGVEKGIDPDGRIVNTDSDVARLKWQLARGFWSREVPPPPKAYLEARHAWNKVCEQEIAAGAADSPGELVDLVLDGRAQRWVINAFDDWEVQKAAHVSRIETSEVHDAVIRTAVAWLKRNPRGIAWVQHLYLGRWLSAVTGYPFFAADGDAIDTYRGQCIASISAHSEGRNLQYAYSNNLLVEVPSSARRWQQLMARTHRPGQPHHTVTYDVVCPADGQGPDGSSSLVRMARAHDESKHRQLQYKLLLADKTFKLSPTSMGEVDPWWVD